MAMTSPGFSTPFLLSSPISGIQGESPSSCSTKTGWVWGPLAHNRGQVRGIIRGPWELKELEMEEMKGRPRSRYLSIPDDGAEIPGVMQGLPSITRTF